MLCIHGNKSSHSFVLLKASNFFFIPVVNSNFKYETYTFSTGTYACTGIVNNLSTFSRQKGKYCFYTYKKKEKKYVSQAYLLIMTSTFSFATYRDHFGRSLSVRLSGSFTELIVALSNLL